jgi:hypothetical protein
MPSTMDDALLRGVSQEEGNPLARIAAEQRRRCLLGSQPRKPREQEGSDNSFEKQRASSPKESPTSSERVS